MTQQFKTFNQLKTEYNIPDAEFSDYHRLISSVPPEWKMQLDKCIPSVISDEINGEN